MGGELARQGGNKVRIDTSPGAGIEAKAAKPTKFYHHLYVQVLIGLALGIVVGVLWPEFGASLKIFGDGFVKVVKMMIAPVVFCTIVLGITSMNDKGEIWKTLLKALGLFYALTIVALVVGLVAVMLVRPGVGMNIDPASIDKTAVQQFTKQAAALSFGEFFLHIIPLTFFGAFAEGEVLPVLFLAVIIGFSLARVGKAGQLVIDGIDSFSHVLFAAFGILMKAAPLGAFGAMAFTVGRYGLKSIGSLAMLMLTFYVACGFFVFVVLGLLARMHGFSLWKLLRYIREELLIVLATSSTEPVLPRLLVKFEKLGCQKGAVGLVLPLGYSFNLDGTAVYLTLATLFLAQAMNIDLTMIQILGLLFLMLLTSKGAAGVTGSGFVALVATLSVMPDIPVVGVALLIGVDRFMSEARALTSVCSNAVAVIVVSMWEGACDRAVLDAELNQNYAATEQALEEGKLIDATLNNPA
jgi:aerobic C4-dicarboxylate transport protein